MSNDLSTETWIRAAGQKKYPKIARHFDDDAKAQRLRLYCDATPSWREIHDTTEAGVSDVPLARLCVVVPTRDIVMIRKFQDTFVNAAGEPNVNQLEYLAIKRALEYCSAEGVENFSIYTDSQTAQARARKHAPLGPGGRVRWLKRDFNPAGIILERITHRARYLTQTETKVAYRRSNSEHDEILHLMQAESIQCPLTELRFWETILKRKYREHTRQTGEQIE
jgi:ribonuclease HI